MKIVILIVWLTVVVFDLCLTLLNMRHLVRYGKTVPEGFEGSIDAERLGKACEYTVATTRFSLLEQSVENVLLFIFLFCGVLPFYDRLISAVSSGFIGGGILFFSGLLVLQTLISIPFSLWRTFHVEAHFGFNATTVGTWLSDLFKSFFIGWIILSLLVSGSLTLVRWSPDRWWLWVWGLFALVTLFLMYISPYVIEPLFFKFEPVQKEGVAQGVEGLMERAGLRAGQVLQVDASRRSRHSNAYFTGIGRVKRIVLFDTLLEQMSLREVLAILAHEVGHWKKGHIFKKLFMMELFSLGTFYIAHALLMGGGLPELFGFSDTSFSAQVVILAFLASLFFFPIAPLVNLLSRRDERQADRFAGELTGDSEGLASALVKLSAENLANLHPHPIYAAFHYSHPPVVERVASLRGVSSN